MASVRTERKIRSMNKLYFEQLLRKSILFTSPANTTDEHLSQFVSVISDALDTSATLLPILCYSTLPAEGCRCKETETMTRTKLEVVQERK